MLMTSHAMALRFEICGPLLINALEAYFLDYRTKPTVKVIDLSSVFGCLVLVEFGWMLTCLLMAENIDGDSS